MFTSWTEQSTVIQENKGVCAAVGSAPNFQEYTFPGVQAKLEMKTSKTQSFRMYFVGLVQSGKGGFSLVVEEVHQK